MISQGSAAIGRIALVLGIGLGLIEGSLFGANDGALNTYLALGDSVAFGLDVRLLGSNPPPPPSKFIGYPEIIGAVERLPAGKVIDSSCPGESSGSFITAGAPDYGCYGLGPQGQPGFKTSIGLHVTYTTSQLQFAYNQLSTNPQINLVSLGIGSNDVLMLIRDCTTQATNPNCVSDGIPGVLNGYGANLAQILGTIRSQYKGTLVLVKYYSPDPTLNQIAIGLNTVMATVGAQFGAKFADGYTAFQIASAPFGGDACRAGLLVPLGPGVCDIHPTWLGSAVLAAAVEAARLGR
jgi:hypothetical protein